MNQKIEHVDFVSSSTINFAEYDYLMENLDVSFKNGGIYRFCGVPIKIFEELKLSESVGKYFHSNIKNNFDYSKKI